MTIRFIDPRMIVGGDLFFGAGLEAITDQL